MTPPEGQTQVIARAQSISLIRCLFRLVKCKFTEPLYKSAWYTLLSLLIFSTYALSIKREGRNLTKKKRKYRGCCGCCIPLRLCSSIARYCDIAVIATALSPEKRFHSAPLHHALTGSTPRLSTRGQSVLPQQTTKQTFFGCLKKVRSFKTVAFDPSLAVLI